MENLDEHKNRLGGGFCAEALFVRLTKRRPRVTAPEESMMWV
jgi:hypothetical protein